LGPNYYSFYVVLIIIFLEFLLQLLFGPYYYILEVLILDTPNPVTGSVCLPWVHWLWEHIASEKPDCENSFTSGRGGRTCASLWPSSV